MVYFLNIRISAAFFNSVVYFSSEDFSKRMLPLTESILYFLEHMDEVKSSCMDVVVGSSSSSIRVHMSVYPPAGKNMIMMIIRKLKMLLTINITKESISMLFDTSTMVSDVLIYFKGVFITF
jgi:hypothetical protein